MTKEEAVKYVNDLRQHIIDKITKNVLADKQLAVEDIEEDILLLMFCKTELVENQCYEAAVEVRRWELASEEHIERTNRGYYGKPSQHYER